MLRSARRDPQALFLGIDPVYSSLVAASLASGRKRPGACNAAFVLASVESLPSELEGLASRVTVNLPWGSLLRTVALPDAALLHNIRTLCGDRAMLDIVYSAAPGDAAQMARVGLEEVDACVRRDSFAAAYAAAGFSGLAIEELPTGGLSAVDTTWARRLARDPRRRAWRISCVAR